MILKILGALISLCVIILYNLWNPKTISGGSISVDDIASSVEYGSITKKERPSLIHHGQLKLFLSEVQFVTENRPEYVVYAGSAPKNTMPILLNMFPGVKWILVDPRIHYFGDSYYGSKDLLYFKISQLPHTNKADTGAGSKTPPNLKLLNLYKKGMVLRENETGYIPDEMIDVIKTSDHKVYLIEDYFTDDLAAMFYNLDCAFISDIRTHIEESPTEADILNDSSMMLSWIDKMRPKTFMIKFRPPWDFNKPLNHTQVYKNNIIDFIEDYRAHKFRFIKGEIQLQAFQGLHSTESRLVGKTSRVEPLDIIEYDIYDYNDKFYYYNKIQRGSQVNTYINKDLGLDKCWDCYICVLILQNYIKQFHSNETVESILKKVFAITKRGLRRSYSSHGI